jgi:L-threonylcarbamoyladenylate synthase
MISQYKTRLWNIHTLVDKPVDKLIDHPHVQAAAQLIRNKEAVAFPTETVYGLGADAFSDQAVQKIFQAKGRPQDNPLIVHIASVTMLAGVVDNVSKRAKLLMDRFWPGPLTLVLPKGEKVCASVTAGLNSVAVRMPAHPVALALILAARTPIAAPSANRSGKPSPTKAEHVWRDLAGRIAGILDGGETTVGLESTVLDLTEERPVLLRPGSITVEQLEEVVGPVDVESIEPMESESDAGENLPFVPRSPGQKYRHYAPEGELFLVSMEKGIEPMRQLIKNALARDQHKGYRVAVLTTDDGLNCYEADVVLSLGPRNQLDKVASRLYEALRRMDQARISKIYAETFPENSMGRAIMNRLRKAAGGRMLVP